MGYTPAGFTAPRKSKVITAAAGGIAVRAATPTPAAKAPVLGTVAAATRVRVPLSRICVSVPIRVHPHVGHYRSAALRNDTVDCHVSPDGLKSRGFQNAGHLRGRVIQLVVSVGLREERQSHSKERKNHRRNHYEFEQTEAARGSWLCAR